MPLEHWDEDVAKIKRKAEIATGKLLDLACKTLVRHAQQNMRDISPIVQADINREGEERAAMGESYAVFRRNQPKQERTLSAKTRKAVKALDTSAPGDYPHKQTGHLSRNITWERHGLEARWGTNVPYGRYLQTGTRLHKVTAKIKKVLYNKITGMFFGKTVEVSMKPRPWMSLTNAACLSEVQKILNGPIDLRISGKGI